MEAKRVKIVRNDEEHHKLEPTVSIVLGQSQTDEPSRFLKVVIQAFTLLPTNRARCTRGSIVQELKGYTSAKVLDLEGDDEHTIIDKFLAEVLERTHPYYSGEGEDYETDEYETEEDHDSEEEEANNRIRMGESATIDMGEVRLHFTVQEVDTPVVFFDSPL